MKFALLEKAGNLFKMSAVTSAVARAVDTGFRAAQARKATFGEAVSQTAGLENNKKSAETLMLLADIKGINTRLGDIIKEAWQLIRIMKEDGTSMVPSFPGRLGRQISKGEAQIKECQGILNKLFTVVPDSCTLSDQRASDFYTWKKRFDELKLGSKHFLPSSVELERSPEFPIHFCSRWWHCSHVHLLPEQ